MRLKVILKQPAGDALASPHDVRVVDAETGVPLEWVDRVYFSASSRRVPRLIVEVVDPEVEIECEGEVGPCSSQKTST